MQAIEMVSRPTMSTSTAERTRTSISDSLKDRVSTSRPNEGRRECVPHRQVVLDAFDKVILEYPDQVNWPQPL